MPREGVTEQSFLLPCPIVSDLGMSSRSAARSPKRLYSSHLEAVGVVHRKKGNMSTPLTPSLFDSLDTF